MSNIQLLRKYIQHDALRGSSNETFQFYLGPHYSPINQEAFMESIEFEYVHNNKQKLSESETMGIGVYVLLDCMDMVETPIQEPLFKLLDTNAFKENNVETYRAYLGKDYSPIEEKQFRNYIYYIFTVFNQPVNTPRVKAVAHYVVGEHCAYSGSDSDSDDVYSSSLSDSSSDSDITSDESIVGTEDDESCSNQSDRNEDDDDDDTSDSDVSDSYTSESDDD